MMKPFYHSDFKLGILGGGQLGRMLLQEAINLDVSLSFLDPAADAPCSALGDSFSVGHFNDYQNVIDFGLGKDLLTVEIEHVNTDALELLEKEGVAVFPQPHLLRMIKDKGLQKQFYAKHKLPTARFDLIESANQLGDSKISFPCVQKLRSGGYDGRGVQVLRCKNDLLKAFDAPSLIEELIDFEQEISIIVARNQQGETKCFPAVGMDFNAEANLVEMLYAPANITSELGQNAIQLATRLIDSMEMVGVLAVEMFVTKSGELLINEMAPRPHNSGHHTIEANITSQYSQHLRAILGLPLGDTKLRQPAVMVNLLGEKGHTGPVHYRGIEEVLQMEGVYIHLYGKSTTKPFRKMGHVTVLAETLNEAKQKAIAVKNTLRVVSASPENI